MSVFEDDVDGAGAGLVVGAGNAEAMKSSTKKQSAIVSRRMVDSLLRTRVGAEAALQGITTRASCWFQWSLLDGFGDSEAHRIRSSQHRA